MQLRRAAYFLACIVLCVATSEATAADKRLKVSGIYPHLTVYNGQHDPKLGDTTGGGGECGIGAVVPWAGKLWLTTYPPHMITGGPDKLWEIDSQLNIKARPESVGGTHASRMIHRESKQLIIGPYFIDEQGTVRACDVKTKLIGRMTATSRHLTDPANLVYFFDMEGSIYEVNVQTLEVKLLFEKPVPGWHGKGAYTGQGRYIVANNGESASGKYGYSKLLVGGKAQSDEDVGALAEWDGRQWRVIERRQFLDVTGPGGIYGNPDDKAPVWAIGWDKRSVILKLLDGGEWYTYRLPKASHAYDPKHGWYTEWPRIREAAPGKWLMDMHGMFFEFPVQFSRGKTGDLRPLCSHLRYVPDFGHWNGETVIAADDTSIMRNPMAGLSQSNLWFGQYDELRHWGPRSGWGGPWQNDAVKAGEPSVPFLIAGFDKRVVHLAHDAKQPVAFKLEIDRDGSGQFITYETIAVPESGYGFHVFPKGFEAAWVRVSTDRDCTATAYFHYSSARPKAPGEERLFAALADLDEKDVCGGLIRPGKTPPLQYLAQAPGENGPKETYFELNEKLRFSTPESRADEVKKVAEVKRDFEIDDASVIMTQGKSRYRLPKGDARFDGPLPLGQPRGIREVQSERYMMNIHGTFYEMPRDAGLPLIRPVASHGKQIMDYCTWRGLLVLCGTRKGAKPDGNYFASADGAAGLWFGNVDDFWKLGKPTGRGGPWKKTAVKADAPSDPYLMTNYDRKRIELSHDADTAVTMTVQVDIDHRGWHTYQAIVVPPGKGLTHEFPDGYAAHWVRVIADKGCTATAQLTYE